MAKIIRRTWTSKGPLGKKTRHTMWGYDARFNGVRERKTSADWLTEEAAVKALAERQRQVAAGQTGRPVDVTFAALCERYLQYKTAQGKRSVHNDRGAITKQFIPAFGAGLLVRQLSAKQIACYEERRIKTVSASTMRNELTILKTMLRLARRWGYIDSVPEIFMPKTPEGRTRFLSEDEIARLFAACARSKNTHLAAVITLALHTGMRKGELLGLRWERVDLDKDLGFNAHIRLHHTKNGKPRGVPLNKASIAALTGIEPDPAKREGSVFKQKNGDDWGQMRTAWEMALKRAGIDDFRFHDLRHTAASS